MKVCVYTDFSQLSDQIDSWRSLVLADPCQPFFMLPEYQTSWWKHLGHGKLEILAVYEDETLVGLLPLYLDSVNQDNQSKQVYRIVGAMDESDYLDLIVRPDKAKAVYQELATYFAQREWQEIWLESLPMTSSTHTDLATAWQSRGWQPQRRLQTVSPVITLPDTWDNYFASLDSKQQKTFRRLQHSIGEDDEIRYRVLTQPNEVELAMATFIKLHKASGPEKASFWNPQREAFFTDVTTQLAKLNLVKLYFLDVNGDPGATLLVFDWQNQFLLYNSGFDAYAYGYLGVSNALVLHTINEAITAKITRYDFMRGNEAYKYLFGASDEPVYDLIITK